MSTVKDVLTHCAGLLIRAAGKRWASASQPQQPWQLRPPWPLREQVLAPPTCRVLCRCHSR